MLIYATFFKLLSMTASLLQAVAVAMPAEAVEELAEAVQDAHGGPIQIVSNGKSPGGGEHSFPISCCDPC